MAAFDVAAGLAEDLKIADYCVLHKLVSQKVIFVQARGVALNVLYHFRNMVEVVG